MNKRMFYRLVLLCGVVLVMTTVGWAKTYHMTSMKEVPAAAGEVDVAKEKNGNMQVHVQVEHLAKPGMLTPSANTYVVWLQEEGSPAQSQGEMKVGNLLKGDIDWPTVLTKYIVFITADIDSHTKTPSDQVVLRATVQQ